MRLGGYREGLGNSRDLNPVSPLLSGTARKKRRKSPGLQHGETPSSLPKKGRREEARGREAACALPQGISPLPRRLQYTNVFV